MGCAEFPRVVREIEGEAQCCAFVIVYAIGIFGWCFPGFLVKINCRKMLDNKGRCTYTARAMKYLTTILTATLLICQTLVADTVTDLRPTIKEAAAVNDVDPVLMEAIIRLESGHAQSKAARTKNNLAGIMGRRGQRRYETKEACVHHLGEILGKYKAKGRVTVEQIGRYYCESRGPWVRGVHAQMKRIRDGVYD